MRERATLWVWPHRRATDRAPEVVVFRVAIAAALLHALDDARIAGPASAWASTRSRPPWALVLGVGAIYAFPAVRPAARAAMAFFSPRRRSSTAPCTSSTSPRSRSPRAISRGSSRSPPASCCSGSPPRSRGAIAARAPPGRGGAGRSASPPSPSACILAFYTVVPIGTALTETHKFREPIGAPPSADYREVAFDAGDGVHLSGWYRPTRNGATIIVLHGGGGDRTGAVAHARLLVRHGYGVLLYDARGRGRSEGTQNAFGWGWTKDIAGALRFLKGRPEVDAERIGGLGLSTGADALVQAAGEGANLHAVVADGTAAESFEDWRRLQGITALTPFLAAEFATVRITSGTRPGPPLQDMIKRISSPLLLVSAGRAEEYRFNAKYDRDAGERPVEHWNLPDARHTGAIREAPAEYERRVTAFFDAALAPDRR